MFWKIVGVLLIGWAGWAGWDLYNDYTSLFETVYRDQDPALYWTAVSACHCTTVNIQNSICCLSSPLI